MRKHLLILFVLLGCALHQSLPLAVENSQASVVEKVINAFKSEDVGEISRLVRYPLERPYPLPAITGPKDFRSGFRSVFDRLFIKRIARSNPLKDWTDMGWRGIMFDDGEIWLNDDGMITAVNYSSAAEQKELSNAIQMQKSKLSASLRHFIKPVLVWETSDYKIRIDELASGKYRYAAWKKGQSTVDAPSLTLTNGTVTYDGSGGNHFYTFKNGRYRYVCYVIELGTADDPPGKLEVYEGNRLLMSQDVLKVR